MLAISTKRKKISEFFTIKFGTHAKLMYCKGNLEGKKKPKMQSSNIFKMNIESLQNKCSFKNYFYTYFSLHNFLALYVEVLNIIDNFL